MWDEECAFSPGLQYTAAVADRVNSPPLFYESWCLYEYLPFGDNRDYITGLTAYTATLGMGISGLATKGSRSKSIGLKEGVPLHFPLRHDERIVAVWSCTSANPAVIDPYLLVSYEVLPLLFDFVR